MRNLKQPTVALKVFSTASLADSAESQNCVNGIFLFKLSIISESRF